MLRYAVIGSGWIAKAYIEGAALAGNWLLDGVCSRTRERAEAFAQQVGAPRCFVGLAQLAQSDVDAVYVASPNALHYAQCKALLQSGKHVLCEKPLTVTAAQNAELCALANRLGLVYLEAIMFLFTPARQVLGEAIARLGNIRSVLLDFSQLSSKYPALQAGGLPNIFNPQFATGALMDIGIYCVYPALFYWGQPQSVLAQAVRHENGIDLAGAALLTYPKHVVSLTYSKVGQSRGVSQILGDKGTVTIDSVSQMTGISHYDQAGNRTLLFGEVPKQTLMGNEAAGFYELIVQRTKNAQRLQEHQKLGIQVSALLQEIRRQCGVAFPQDAQ